MRNSRCLALAWAIALISLAAGAARMSVPAAARPVADPPPGYCAYVNPPPSTGWGGAVVCTP